MLIDLSPDSTIDRPAPAGASPARSSRRHASAGRLWKPADPRTGEPCAVWWLDYSIRGKRYRESAKTTVRAEAAKLLRQRLAEHASGRYAPNAERLTLEQLVDGLRTHYRLAGRRSLRRAMAAFAHLRAYFGAEARAVDITAARLEAYAAERVQTAAPATVHYELGCLGKAMSLAVKGGALSTRPAFPTITVDNVRVGFFEAEELAAVLAQLPIALRPAVRFAAITGWRKAEVLGLTWDRVDFTAGLVRLDPGTTKSRAGRVYPFTGHPELLALLEGQRTYTAQVQKRIGAIVPVVFHREGRPIKRIDKAWRSACRRAAAPGKLFHDLRRTSARALVRAGVSETVAMQLTGHKTRSIFDRYNITSGRDLVEAVAKLAAQAPAPAATPKVVAIGAARGA